MNVALTNPPILRSPDERVNGLLVRA